MRFESRAHRAARAQRGRARRTANGASEFQRSLLERRAGGDHRDGRRGRWIVFNPFAEHLLGWRAEEVIGRVPRHGTRAAAGRFADAGAASEARTHRRRARGQRWAARCRADWRAMYVLAELRAAAARSACCCTRRAHGAGACWRWPRSRTKRADRGGLIAVATDLTERKRLEADAARQRSARAGGQPRQERRSSPR